MNASETLRTSPRLTRASAAVLDNITWREDVGTCFLVPTGQGRLALIVPDGLVGNPLVRRAAYSGATIGSLAEAGLIELGQEAHRLFYAYRTPRDGAHGQTIALTAAGREARKRRGTKISASKAAIEAGGSDD